MTAPEIPSSYSSAQIKNKGPFRTSKKTAAFPGSAALSGDKSIREGGFFPYKDCAVRHVYRMRNTLFYVAEKYTP